MLYYVAPQLWAWREGRMRKHDPAQLIITSVHDSGLEGVKLGRKFHVKQGNFL